ncbi:hypothetical protein DFH09DRAFT_42192 [Mycena vulgaris]|nr:hypothetical protein DFH09DRAFT_42192 [Mycena vulgaris]
MHADTEPTDPRAISGEIDGDYERYLAGDYDSIELSSFDSSEVSDSCDTTGSDCGSIFDSMTDFEADSSLSSCSEPDDTDQSFEPGVNFRNYSFLSDIQVPEFAEQHRYIESIAVSDSEPYALSYSFSYATSDAAFDPERDSLEHTDVQQSDESESDLPAIHTFVEHTQLSIPPSSPFSNSYSEPNSITELFLESFYTEQKSSELGVAFTNDKQDLNTIYKPAETAELKSFSTEQKYSEPSTVHTSDEQDTESIYNLYFRAHQPELSFIPLPMYSESESTTDLFLELFYTEQNSPELGSAFADDKRDLDLIYEPYFNAEFSELSSHLPFTCSISDSEPASITDTFIELILSQETSRRVDSETIASASERDSSTHTHANFNEDLCTIFELYTDQHEYSIRAEPSKRAESQPFSLRTSYVHDFVPELLQSCTESHAHARIEPTDNLPSYQESVLTSEPSFAYARPRIRAESFIHLLFHLSFIALSIFLAVLRCFYSLIVSLFSKLHADHNFETIAQIDSMSKLEPSSANPPSHQESILVSERSFAYARPRIRAEFCTNLLLHLFLFALCVPVALLRRFFCFIVSLFSESHADHNFETIPHSYSALKREFYDADPTANYGSRRHSHSIYTKILIPAEPRPPDKHLHFISSYIPHIPTSCSVPHLKPLFCSDFEGEI